MTRRVDWTLPHGTTDRVALLALTGCPVVENQRLPYDFTYVLPAYAGGPRIVTGERAHFRWELEVLHGERMAARAWLQDLVAATRTELGLPTTPTT